MQQNKSVLYFFLSLTRGSWRNAFYLECPVCPYGKDKCGGYLLTTDVYKRQCKRRGFQNAYRSGKPQRSYAEEKASFLYEQGRLRRIPHL